MKPSLTLFRTHIMMDFACTRQQSKCNVMKKRAARGVSSLHPAHDKQTHKPCKGGHASATSDARLQVKPVERIWRNETQKSARATTLPTTGDFKKLASRLDKHVNHAHSRTVAGTNVLENTSKVVLTTPGTCCTPAQGCNSPPPAQLCCTPFLLYAAAKLNYR